MRSQHGKSSATPHNNYELPPTQAHPRTGEDGSIPFRSSRFFCVGNRWYFTTREGFDSGPYASRERAGTGLKRFLHVVKLLPDDAAIH